MTKRNESDDRFDALRYRAARSPGRRPRGAPFAAWALSVFCVLMAAAVAVAGWGLCAYAWSNGRIFQCVWAAAFLGASVVLLLRCSWICFRWPR